MTQAHIGNSFPMEQAVNNEEHTGEAVDVAAKGKKTGAKVGGHGKQFRCTWCYNVVSDRLPRHMKKCKGCPAALQSLSEEERQAHGKREVEKMQRGVAEFYHNLHFNPAAIEDRLYTKDELCHVLERWGHQAIPDGVTTKEIQPLKLAHVQFQFEDKARSQESGKNYTTPKPSDPNDIESDKDSDDNNINPFQIENVSDTLSLIQKQQESYIQLNIGGTTFHTSKSTLFNSPYSLLHQMTQPNSPIEVQRNCIFIDRDPCHFRFILNYLRNECKLPNSLYPTNSIAIQELLLDAKFYNIKELISDLKKLQKLNCIDK